MQEYELVEIFSSYGAVHAVTIVTDQETGRSKGYGFLTIDDDAGARSAIEGLNGKIFDGRTLNVRMADNKPLLKESSTQAFNHDSSSQDKQHKGIPEASRPKRRRRL